MDKILTVALLGAGARGNTYSKYMAQAPNKYKIVAVCDIITARADAYAATHNIDKANVFYDEKSFFATKRADLLIVATQDQDHVEHAVKGLACGYDILTEKPISDKESECRRLLTAQKTYGGKVFVCHVLRYAPAYRKVKELLDSGIIGNIVMIDSIEQVWYFHQAHSYVRGNWRRVEDTSPMIIAKCCHDLDLLQWYAGSKCETISSIGDLRFFKKENQPDDAADRCTECKLQNTCPYSAVTGYSSDNGFWGRRRITEVPTDDQNLINEALKTGPYGRCVFASDNTAVDNQITTMRFENGITATLRMTAFTAHGGRIMKFYGTYGEIVFDEHEKFIAVKIFGKQDEIINIEDLTEAGYGHGGGDSRLVATLYDMLTGNATAETSLAASIESHLMGFAAEKSRLANGAVITIIH